MAAGLDAWDNDSSLRVMLCSPTIKCDEISGVDGMLSVSPGSTPGSAFFFASSRLRFLLLLPWDGVT